MVSDQWELTFGQEVKVLILVVMEYGLRPVWEEEHKEELQLTS